MPPQEHPALLAYVVALRDKTYAARDEYTQALAAFEVPFLTLRQQAGCQGEGSCVCSTLAAAVQQLQASVLGYDAVVHKFIEEASHMPEVLHAVLSTKNLIRESYSEMWDTRAMMAALLADVAKQLLVRQHTPDAVTAMAAAYNQ